MSFLTRYEDDASAPTVKEALRDLAVRVLAPGLVLFQVGGPIVRPAVGILHGMGKLVLYPVDPVAQHFIQQRACGGPEPVWGHLLFGVTEGAKGNTHGIVR